MMKFFLLSLFFPFMIHASLVDAFLLQLRQKKFPLTPTRQLQLEEAIATQRLLPRQLVSIPEDQIQAPVSLDLHATSMTIHEDYDDWTNDHAYMVFFMTVDGIPYGKITSTYTELDEGDSFFLLPEDRVLFPLASGKSLIHRHLVIDYAFFESDGDDLATRRELSQAVIDLAIALISSSYPSTGPVLNELREEVQLLLEAINTLDQNDRLALGTVAKSAQQWAKFAQSTSPFISWSVRHQGQQNYSDWDWELFFRIYPY